MKLHKVYLLCVGLLLLTVPSSLISQAGEQYSNNAPLTISPFPIDQIIVKFHTESSLQISIQSDDQSEALDRLSALIDEPLRYAAPMSGDAHIVQLPEPASIEQVTAYANQIASLADVDYAEPNSFVQRQLNPSDVNAPLLTPNDAFFKEQWHLHYTPNKKEGIRVESAWDSTMGSSDVIVAVIDTGLLLNHPDIVGQTVPGYDLVSNTLISKDGNGRDADPSDPGDWGEAGECGINSPFFPSSWHGTHVAGTIGARTNNSTGVAGIASDARILPVRTLGLCGIGIMSDIIDSIRWAAGLPVVNLPLNNNPAHVINMSLGAPGSCSQAMQSAVSDALAAGSTIIVASGNDTKNASGYYLTNCAGVLSVAATNKAGKRTSYSNFGKSIAIAAPGGDGTVQNPENAVLSTSNAGLRTPAVHAYSYQNGTSMAAPHVAGVAALILSIDPSLTPTQVKTILLTSARPFPAGSNCSDGNCGAGIVDAATAVECVSSNSRAVQTPTVAQGSFAVFLPWVGAGCS